jgi:imidazolonepropionase-like amidohydrolase
MLKRLSLILLSLFAGAAPAAAETLVVHAGRLITDASQRARGASTITIVDGRIQAIADGHVAAPAGARLIDLSTRTVLPGLIDTHVHLSSDPGGDFWREATEPDEWATLIGVKNARTTARAGFTTVRDLGSPRDVGFALARGTAEGIIAGPRVIASGPPISIIGGHGDVNGFRREVTDALSLDNTCTGAAECAARVREFARAGAQVIKFTATGGVLSQQARGLEAHFSDEEMRAIVTTAHALGLRVAAHAHGARGIEAAARAGVDSIEHGTFADARALQAMRASGSAMVPTMLALVGVREGLGRGIYTPAVEAKIRETVEHLGRAGRAARQAGVTVVFGTDAGVYAHGRNAQEFAMMVELLGMTPAQALASATTGAARLLDLENEVGRIAPGMSADLIAVTGDPLTDIRTLEQVGFAMVRGRVVE